MSSRRSLAGLLGVAVLAVSACAGTGASGAPSLALSSITVPSGALPSVALEGFCADFSTQLQAKWPNIDASTAMTLAPLVRQWADKPEMASVQADATTVFTWVSLMSTSASVSSPPPDVMTAYDNLKTFADTNC